MNDGKASGEKATDAVLVKVARLRALAARAGTQAEAEAAAAAAERLIAQYQIDEARLDAADPTRAEEPAEGEVLWEGKSVKVWLNVLANGLCVDHGCAIIIERKTKGRKTLNTRLRFAGAPKDMELVRYLFAWLHLEIDRLARREHGIAAINAFRVGAAQGVLAAMRAARTAEIFEQKVATGVAMVLVERSDRSLAFLKARIGGKFKQGSGPSLHNADAYARGMKAGQGMSARHGLTAGSGRLALGSGKKG
jgi:hypothetical protein